MCKALRQIPDKSRRTLITLPLYAVQISLFFTIEIKGKLFTSGTIERDSFTPRNLHLYCLAASYLSVFIARYSLISRAGTFPRAQFPVETEDATISLAYVSGTITKGRESLICGSPFLPVNKYTSRPVRAAGSRRVQLVKRIVFRDVSGYWLSLAAGISSAGRGSSFCTVARLARGASIPAYLTYKDINIEWQVHSGQSRHTPPGHELFSTHAKLVPLWSPVSRLLARPYPRVAHAFVYILRSNLIP